MNENPYYNEGATNCSCVECFTNRVVDVLGGSISFYMSYNYRYAEAFCPECGLPVCARAEFHGNQCNFIKDEK